MSTQTPGRVRFDALGIATTDLTASLAFYRRLGLEFPEGAERAPHVEAQVAGGIRLMWDVVPAEEAPAGAAARSWPSCATRPPAWTPCTPS